MSSEYETALKLVEKQLASLRKGAKRRDFDSTKPAEIEVNKFYFKGKEVDRVMVVLRASGCQAYKDNYGCSVCGHIDGTPINPVTPQQYLAQWQAVKDGSALDKKTGQKFDLNDYPILCLYNLGSLLNSREVSEKAVKDIFRSINTFPGIKKTIIESRAEYVTDEAVKNILDVYHGILEVGIGLESSNRVVRQLCHHKNMPDLERFERAIEILHNNGALALAYVNQKPPFLTEKESIDDAVETSVYAFSRGLDAVSIEPTSLQANSLADYLYRLGVYRVPWLWSVAEAAKGIHARLKPVKGLDLRLGGYFDEQILSGSQGVAPGVKRNELFPHKTSENCSACTPRFIELIKKFNRTYDINTLTNKEGCPHCYPLWKGAISITDSRSIPKRIIETLGEQLVK